MVLLSRKAPYNLQYNLQSILWHLTGNTCVVFPSNIAQYRIQRIKKSLRQHVNAPVTVRQRANFAKLCSFILSTLSITFTPSLLDYCILPVIQNLPYQRREELKISCLKNKGPLRQIVMDTKQTLFAVHETYSGEYDTIFSDEMLTFWIISLTDSMAFTCSVVVFIRICWIGIWQACKRKQKELYLFQPFLKFITTNRTWINQEAYYRFNYNGWSSVSNHWTIKLKF